MAAKSRSAKFYRDNPDARKKKAAYDKKLNARPEQVNKREDANRERRRAKKRGVDVRGKDWDHAVRRMVKSSTNRGRRGEGGRVRFSKRR